MQVETTVMYTRKHISTDRNSKTRAAHFWAKAKNSGPGKPSVLPRDKLKTAVLLQSPKRSRSRLVWARLTGISVCFLSSIRNWYELLNQGTTSRIRFTFTRNDRCARQ